MKKPLIRIGIAFILMLCGMTLPFDKIMSFSPANTDNAILVVFLIAYLIVGHDVVVVGLRNVFSGQAFDENLLMTIATLGAFFVGDYPEAVAVMLFYQVGELFQDYAVNKSRKSISAMMDIRPDFANVLKKDGTVEKVDPKDVKIGDIIVVRPGEKVPLDGTILKGNGSLNVAALTGESLPKDVVLGENIISGSISIDGEIEAQVTKSFGESTVSKILELVENASDRKAKAENFITRFARYYTPIVVVLALMLAILPPLITGGDWSSWIYRALTFLVVSCPCALVISVPLSFFGGIGAASTKGVLVKGSNYLEELAKADTVVFDKTGTITKGQFKVVAVNIAKGNFMKEKQLISMAAYAESKSTHPIAKSIINCFKEIDPAGAVNLEKSYQMIEVKEVAGNGIEAKVNNDTIFVGKPELLRAHGIECEECNEIGTVIYVATSAMYLGNILIRDEIKETSSEAIREIKNDGVKKTIMLTGDKEDIAKLVADEVGIDEFQSGLLPGDKVDKVEQLLENEHEGSLVFVGDGINDAPVLARADVGVAMGALGSDAAIEAADVVLMDDNPMGISKAIRIARKTVRIVKENIVFALGVKVIVLILAALGWAPMWLAIFADVGVAVIAIINALRTLKVA